MVVIGNHVAGKAYPGPLCQPVDPVCTQQLSGASPGAAVTGRRAAVAAVAAVADQNGVAAVAAIAADHCALAAGAAGTAIAHQQAGPAAGSAGPRSAGFAESTRSADSAAAKQGGAAADPSDTAGRVALSADPARATAGDQQPGGAAVAAGPAGAEIAESTGSA
ncbi:hypothetical protein [Mycobacterium riyadhense]